MLLPKLSWWNKSVKASTRSWILQRNLQLLIITYYAFSVVNQSLILLRSRLALQHRLLWWSNLVKSKPALWCRVKPKDSWITHYSLFVIQSPDRLTDNTPALKYAEKCIPTCMWWGNVLVFDLPEGQVWWVRPSSPHGTPPEFRHCSDRCCRP